MLNKKASSFKGEVRMSGGDKTLHEEKTGLKEVRTQAGVGHCVGRRPREAVGAWL